MREPIYCDFCDHETVSVRLDGTFTCEYCGAGHLLQDWEDYETNNSIRAGDLREVSETTQVQIRGTTPAPGQVEVNEPRNSSPSGD